MEVGRYHLEKLYFDHKKTAIYERMVGRIETNMLKIFVQLSWL